MNVALLTALGLGAPGLGLLIARWLTSDDVGQSMRRHQEALAVLAELTGPPIGVGR